MSWNFSNDKPIFQQLMDIIIKNIINGKYKLGEKLPPVRDLSVEAGVNPNTMQRALSEIESKGIVNTRRGDGRYVCEDINLINKIKDEYVSVYANDFIKSLKSFGLSDDEIVESLKNFM